GTARIHYVGDVTFAESDAVDDFGGADAVRNGQRIIRARIGNIRIVFIPEGCGQLRIGLPLPAIERPCLVIGVALAHAFEYLRGEFTRVQKPFQRMPLRPQGLSDLPGVELCRLALLYRLEIDLRPGIRGEIVELPPRGNLDHLVVLLQSADQVVLMPTREYDKLLAVVVQAEVCNGGVPLPAGFPDNGRITLLRILIQVVDYQDVDGIARKTAATADTQQTTPVADDF